MKLNTGLSALILALSSVSANAATIFAPTDGDVNFLFGDLIGGTLAMFDDSDQSYTGTGLEVTDPDIVGIAGPFANNDHIASNSLGDTLILTGSDHFILGLNVGGNWLSDSLVNPVGGNAYQVLFNNGGTIVEVDVEIIPAVPVPPAVWLFFSGIIGLVVISRRRA